MKAIIGLCVAAAALGVANVVMEAKKRRDLKDSEEYFEGLANEMDREFRSAEDEMYANVDMNGASPCEGCPDQGECSYHKQPDGLRKEPVVEETCDFEESETFEDSMLNQFDKNAKDAWHLMPSGRMRPFTNLAYDRTYMSMAKKCYSRAATSEEFRAYANIFCRVRNPHINRDKEELPLEPNFVCSSCQLYDLCRTKIAELTGCDLGKTGKPQETTEQGFAEQGFVDQEASGESAGDVWTEMEDEDDIDLKAIFGKFSEKGSELGDTASIVMAEAKEIAKDVGHKAVDVGSKFLTGSAKGLAVGLKFAAKQASVVSRMLDDMIIEKPVVDDAAECPDLIERDECGECPDCEGCEKDKAADVDEGPCVQGCSGCNGCGQGKDPTNCC